MLCLLPLSPHPARRPENVCMLYGVEAEGSSTLSRLSPSDVLSASSAVLSLYRSSCPPFNLSLFGFRRQNASLCSSSPRTFPTSPPLVVVASQQNLFMRGGGTHALVLCLISFLINELPPPFHPSILQTCTYILVYFCTILSLFQFTMARGAHPHPRCVFLGRLEEKFPLHHALISASCSGNSQLARPVQSASHGGPQRH